ncbi:hypothetical protein BAE44_0002734, partial [Dichanthelium oligosanthes]
LGYSCGGFSSQDHIYSHGYKRFHQIQSNLLWLELWLRGIHIHGGQLAISHHFSCVGWENKFVDLVR